MHMTRNDGLRALAAQPSPAFARFLDNYFGHPMLLGREEEDPGVLDELQGRERAVAADMVLSNLDRLTNFGLAAARLRDERAIPKLQDLVERARDPYERLHAAKVLHDWVGFDGYLPLLDRLLPHLGTYGKNKSFWVSGLPRAEVIRVLFGLLADPDSFVRWCAYSNLRRHFQNDPPSYDSVEAQRRFREQALCYVGEEVFRKPLLFRARLDELRREVESWPDPKHG